MIQKYHKETDSKTKRPKLADIKNPLYIAFIQWIPIFSICSFIVGYFPIQNFPKIFPNISSVEICPVISPK